MRLGDLDYLARWLKAVIASLPIEDHKARTAFSECLAKVNAMEEVKAEPVRHGRWIPTRPYMHSTKCTICGNIWDLETPRCPSCGAKMDLEEPINE